MKIKTGKDEIVYLLDKVIEKYESDSGEKIIRNSNRKNYEAVAKKLSEISNKLPETAVALDHRPYSTDYNVQRFDYPFRKYDISGNQIKDACYNQIVTTPRPFLVDACYIYLYGTGRKGFAKNPTDPNLLTSDPGPDDETNAAALDREHHAFDYPHRPGKPPIFVWALAIFALLVASVAIYQWLTAQKNWETVRRDMKLLPYQPAQREIDSLEGIWLCYTGSPQARTSNPNRYHLVVSNVVDVRYKNGYFTFNRYGASFDHSGYMQFEAPSIVSIHSHVKNNTDSIENPRHSLMRLDGRNRYISAISASWNFDVGNENKIIGIREIYVKQGKGGHIEEVINTIENASCKCKIIRWKQVHGEIKNFHLKNELLDTIGDEALKVLLDEKSILLYEPSEGTLLSADTLHLRK